MKRNIFLAFLAVLIVLVSSFIANATPITFTHEGSGSGVLDKTSFSLSAFMITATGDTDDIIKFTTGGGSTVFYIEHLTTSIQINNLGIFDFITPTRTWVNNNLSRVGFSLSYTIPAPYDGSDLFQGPYDSGFGSWDMQSSIGPIAGGGSLLQWDLINVQTTDGVLEFTDQSTSAVFNAVVGGGTVPEPSSMVLVGFGLFGIAALGRKRIK